MVWWFGGLVVWWFGGLVVWWFGGEVSDIGDIIRFSLLARIMPLTSG
ncbi:hypothetical protein [Yersinia ruckeri]|nr:hypothetical protein [Yersinia ruckeri]UZY10203.1 hypothetical protein LNQ46_009695 [Yersinia ruckeri]